MKTYLIVMIMMIAPLLVNAQTFNPPTAKMQDPLFNQWGNQRPKVLGLESVKPLSRSRIENAQIKVANEERKLVKLAREAWDMEDALKEEKEKLKNLENTPENSITPDRQKKIEKSRKQIAKSQDKLNKAKLEIDLKSKELKDMEAAIESAKLKII